MCLYSLKIILLIENLKKTTTTTTNYHQMQPDNQTRARKWHLPNCCLIKKILNYEEIEYERTENGIKSK